jgi:hypothetical protein
MHSSFILHGVQCTGRAAWPFPGADPLELVHRFVRPLDVDTYAQWRDGGRVGRPTFTMAPVPPDVLATIDRRAYNLKPLALLTRLTSLTVLVSCVSDTGSGGACGAGQRGGGCTPAPDFSRGDGLGRAG